MLEQRQRLECVCAFLALFYRMLDWIEALAEERAGGMSVLCTVHVRTAANRFSVDFFLTLK